MKDNARGPWVVISIVLLTICSTCKTPPAREPGEPVDLPLDDIEVAEPADGGAGEPQVDAVDGGTQAEGAGAGEPQEPLGIDLRDM